MRKLISFLFICGLFAVGCTEPLNQEGSKKNESPRILTPEPTTEKRLTGQYIITLKEGTSIELIKQVFQKYGIKSIQVLSKNHYLITLENDPGLDDLDKQAKTFSEIINVQPNYLYRAM